MSDEEALFQGEDNEIQELHTMKRFPAPNQQRNLPGLALVFFGTVLTVPSVIATLSSAAPSTHAVAPSSLMSLSSKPDSQACGKRYLLDFSHSEVTNNNLGSQGPDMHHPEGIVIKNVMPGAAAPVNLKIKVSGDSTYFPGDVSQNGINDGAVQINVKSGSQVDIHAQLVDEHDNPVTLDAFFVSFIDVAAGEIKGGRILGRSQLIMKQYSKVFSTQGVQTLIPDYGIVEFQNTRGSDGEVTFLLNSASEFSARLSVTGGSSFQTFKMVGKTNLVCD